MTRTYVPSGQRRVIAYMVAIAFTSTLIGSGASLAVAWRANEESDKKWCSVVVTLDNAWHEAPPTTKSGKNLAADISALRKSLHCPTS